MTAGRAALLGAVATACASGLPNASPAVGPLDIATREAVVRIGAYARVPAVAVSNTRAFVVGEEGVAIYDRSARRWLAPIALPGFRIEGREARVLAATNLIGDVVWVAGGGRVFVVSPNLRSATPASVYGEPRALRVDRSGANAYVLTDQWWEVGATGGARPIAAADLPPRERLADIADGSDPAVRRAIDDRLVTRDEALRSWPVISAARGATPSDVWLGTAGGGVFHVDPDFHRSEQMAFGLRSGPVTALVRTADGILAAEQPTVAGTGLAVVTEGSDDLSRWRWIALADQVGSVRGIAIRGRTLCVAGESGSGLVDLGASGLPATLARLDAEQAAVALATRDGCAIGTWRGVTLLPWPGGADSVRASAQTPPVYALAASGDTIWAGTREGVVAVVRGRVAGIARPVPAGGEIVALALVEDGLAVATQSEVAITRGAAVERLALPLGALGRLTSLAADDRTLWIGGSQGALALDLATRVTAPVPLAPPGVDGPEPPGGREIRAIVLAPGVAWLGTAAGLVRVRRGADGFPR